MQDLVDGSTASRQQTRQAHGKIQVCIAGGHHKVPNARTFVVGSNTGCNQTEVGHEYYTGLSGWAWVNRG